MNFNIASYLIYLPVTFYIIIVVGLMFFRNGEYYIENIFPGNPQLVRVINRMLLLGYYLLNLGYVTLIISFWQHINSIQQMCEVLSSRIGIIMLVLGALHFNNMFCIWWFGKKFKQQSIHL